MTVDLMHRLERIEAFGSLLQVVRHGHPHCADWGESSIGLGDRAWDFYLHRRMETVASFECGHSCSCMLANIDRKLR